MAERPWMTIGSRGSPLALAQTHEVRDAIAAAHDRLAQTIAVEVISTTGDRVLDRPLAEIGGKGLFTKELDAALLDGRIDCAVHSAKDLPTFLPAGLDIAGYRPREDVRDVFVSTLSPSLNELPQSATFGSASPRRRAQALALRPDLTPVLLRGNVETRLRRVESGEIGATILALAGLKRLGLAARATLILAETDFLPAAAQGAVAITVRSEDHRTRVALGAALDAETGFAVTAERAFLAVLDGSCRTPIACHARLCGDRLELEGQALAPDGGESWRVADEGPADQAQAVGTRAGRTLLAQMPDDFRARWA
jgi:hydroxymethylbilane synthase